MSSAGVSHIQAVDEIHQYMMVLQQDPLLLSLSKVTVDELEACIAIQEGRALNLTLRLCDDHIIPLVVLQGCNVGDVMKVIESAVKQTYSGTASTVVSWNYVWNTYWLACGQSRLEDKLSPVVKYGVCNHSELRFVKKHKTKEQHVL